MSGAWSSGSQRIGGQPRGADVAGALHASAAATAAAAPVPCESFRPLFDYYLVLDFEATCEEQFRIPNQEIIEFPSVLIDASTTTVVSEFQRYVRPIKNPRLSAFCTSLTGITQDQVDTAETFPTVFAQWQAWLEAGNLGEVPPKKSFAIVTCGDWDLKTMLPCQAGISGTPRLASFLRRWINLKVVFQKHVSNGVRPKGMEDMLAMVKKPLLGRHHSGIDDCRNIATVLIAILRRGIRVDYTWISEGMQRPVYFNGASGAPPPPTSVVLPRTHQVAEACFSEASAAAPPAVAVAAAAVDLAVLSEGDLVLAASSPDTVRTLIAATPPAALPAEELNALSKALAHVLRHGALSMGLALTRDGYASIDALLAIPKFSRQRLTPSTLAHLVAIDTDGRFSIVRGNDGLCYIRANSGHSIKGLVVPPTARPPRSQQQQQREATVEQRQRGARTSGTPATAAVASAAVSFHKGPGDPVADILSRAAPAEIASIADQPRGVSVKQSIALSQVLRHGAHKLGVPITHDGWIALTDLRGHPRYKDYTDVLIAEIVRTSDKQRYALAYGAHDGRVYIRANQGHTMQDVTIDMRPIQDQSEAPVCVHGTDLEAWPLIKAGGLSRMTRQHIHFAKGLPGDNGVISGMRKSCQVLIYLDVGAALSAGIPLFESSNGVLLSPGMGDTGVIPTCFFLRVLDAKTFSPLKY